jgi:hypothetical protein
MSVPIMTMMAVRNFPTCGLQQAPTHRRRQEQQVATPVFLPNSLQSKSPPEEAGHAASLATAATSAMR